MSSLVSIFTPSAMNCPNPKRRVLVNGKPTRLGPSRFWIRAKPFRSRIVVMPKRSGKNAMMGRIESRIEIQGVKLSGQKAWTRIQCLKLTKIWSRAVMLASQERAGERRAAAVAERGPVLRWAQDLPRLRRGLWLLLQRQLSLWPPRPPLLWLRPWLFLRRGVCPLRRLQWDESYCSGYWTWPDRLCGRANLRNGHGSRARTPGPS